jgi:small conductance mechanosensitive channel
VRLGRPDAQFKCGESGQRAAELIGFDRYGATNGELMSFSGMSPQFLDVALMWALRVLYAAAILGIGLWLAFFLSGVARRHAEKNPRIDTTLGAFLARSVRYGLITIVLIIVLQMFGVQTASLVAILGASALAIGLALQGTLTNVASGIIVALIRPFRIGDFVEIDGKEGLVTDLDLFFTEIRSSDNRRILVPNGQAISNPIINHTTAGQRCCVLTVGVGYQDDLGHALAELKRVMLADPRASTEPVPWFGVQGLGESSVLLSALVWVKTREYRMYRADMLKAIKEAFDAEGIEMPYPHSVQISKCGTQPRLPSVKQLAEAKSEIPLWHHRR